MLAFRCHLARLPPVVVGRVGHVHDVAVLEGDAARRQAAVLGGVVVEERAHVQRLLGGRLETAAARAHHLFAQVVNLRLEAVVLGRLVLRNDVHHVARALQCRCCLLVSRVLQVDAVNLNCTKIMKSPEIPLYISSQQNLTTKL